MRKLQAAVAIVACSVLLTASTSSANGATPCPAGKYCVWADSNRSGPGLILGVHHHKVTNVIANQLNNAVSSAENQTGFTVLFFTNRNGNGTALCLESGTTYNDFAVYTFNDVTSSSKVVGHTICI